ncbi:Serine/threonine protein kinase [Chondrus crispus]|uniref:non-specific serine/threonine protein kinase n=1 Tax=Chondrus crispus TaxID=2769 RepID=R7Q8Q5_CHOCR|nr:Serine/threonine protein kinase [Chondrus crispus]CDF34183.1 Serine/threonine protein kinase [Chondrus crispus]|eukprot:XP_005714002.1 Serine/threonine protein kinase [Chondrus crispus]
MASTHPYPLYVRPQRLPPSDKCVRVGPYILTETIGSGATSKVKIAVHQGTDDRYACKIMDKRDVRENTNSRQVRKEVSAMRCLDHDNVVSLKSVLTTSSKIYIIMELVEGSELFNEIRAYTKLSEPYARHFFKQLIDGLQHCHQQGVCHRDLKPENLMITDDKILKITDFGLCNLKRGGPNGAGGGTGFMNSVTSSLFMRTQCGTPNFVAPEIVCLDDEHSPGTYSGSKVDIWACGVILFNLVAGHLPFNSAQTEDLFHDIVNGNVPYPDWFSASLVDLIGNMLEVDPKERYTLKQIRAHEWFNEQSYSFNSTPPVIDTSGENPAHRFLSTAVLTRESESLTPVMHRNPQSRSMHALQQGIAYPGQDYHTPHMPHTQPIGTVETRPVSLKHRTVDSLDFGDRVNTAEGDLLAAYSSQFTASDAGQQAAPQTRGLESTRQNLGSGMNVASSTTPASGNTYPLEREENTSNATSMTGDHSEEYESEELEDYEVYHCSHLRQVRFASPDTSLTRSLRRAKSSPNVANGLGVVNDMSNEGSLPETKSMGFTQGYARDLEKQQLWNNAFGQHALKEEGVQQPRVKRSSSHEHIVNPRDSRRPSWNAIAYAGGHVNTFMSDTGESIPSPYRSSVLRSWQSLNVGGQNAAPIGTHVGQEPYSELGSGNDACREDYSREWLRSEAEKVQCNRTARDFDLVPDSEEFNMESWQLNQIWTTSLQAENLGNDFLPTKRAVRFADIPDPAKEPTRLPQQNMRPAQPVLYGTSGSIPISSLTGYPETAVDYNYGKPVGDPVEGMTEPRMNSKLPVLATNHAPLPAEGLRIGGQGPVLSAVPAHMIKEMLPPKRAVSPGRFSPNGRTPVTEKDLVASVVSSIPSPRVTDSETAGIPSPARGRVGPLPGLEPTPEFVKLGIGEDFHGIPTSGAESWLTGSGGGSDQNAGSSSSNGLSSEKTSSTNGTGLREPIRGISGNTLAEGATLTEIESYNLAQLRTLQTSPSSALADRDDSVVASSSPMTSDAGRQKEAIENESEMVGSQASKSQATGPATSQGGSSSDAKEGVQVSRASQPPLTKATVASQSGARSLFGRLPGIHSAKRQLLGRSSSRLETKSTTQFQTHNAPERCFKAIKELLIDHGCSYVKGGALKKMSGDMFTLRCEYKRAKANVVVVAKITISRFDEVLTSVLFERQGRTSKEQFDKFYSSVYNLYREAAYKDE